MERERSIDLGGNGKRSKKVDQFYHVKVSCSNCPHSGECRIPKGLPIDMYPCPHCHCQRLKPVHGA